MMKNIRNILFDLDGTLIESSEGIINSILYSLDKMRVTEERPGELKDFIGPPLIQSYIHRYQLDHDTANLAVSYYREYFSAKGIYENNLYPGIRELLNLLVGNRFNLFVATSKPTVYADIIIKHHKLDHLFQGVVGSNLDHTRLEKTEIIGFLLEEFNLAGSFSGETNLRGPQAIMIGDRIHDIIGAKNNNLKSVFVTYGHGSKDKLVNVKPDWIVDSTEGLKRLLTDSLF
jgi:phosphoglycolate phosphatase